MGILIATAWMVLASPTVHASEIGQAKPPPREVMDTAERAKVLVGRWVRTDAYYVIEVRLAEREGAVVVGYFNPKPINVGRAEYADSVAGLVLTVVLQDVNYPGSKYILTYDETRDALIGTYFQAVQGITFDVAFIRQR